jgi:hypothetical protein
MGHINFKNYLTKFEKEVILAGVVQGIFNTSQWMSVKNNALSSSTFAKMMGRFLPYDEVFVLDYYGYSKKSAGFYNMLKEQRKHTNGQQVKMMQSVVVHFNSIKIEQMAELTSNTYLLSNFTEFKNRVLQKRGFKNNGS